MNCSSLRSRLPSKDVHISVVGERGVGKSAFTLKYITKRFIGEYDGSLEETYCKEEKVDGECLQVWLMDTVDAEGREHMRWMSWSDVVLVLFDITCSKSLSHAQSILHAILSHEHTLCARTHEVMLVGNKSDLERYRVVSEAEALRVATTMHATYAQCSATDVASVNEVVRAGVVKARDRGAEGRQEESRQCSSDSEMTKSRGGAKMSRSSSGVKESSKLNYLHKSPSLSKMNKTGSKLFKLFHN